MLGGNIMKKLIGITVSLLLVFALTSCGVGIDIGDGLFNIDEFINLNDDGSTSDEIQSNSTNDRLPTLNNGKVTDGESGLPDDGNNDGNSNGNDNNSNNNNNNNNNNTAALGQINNGILKDASTETMSVPVNMKFLGTEDATEENNSKKIKATVVMYSLDGDVVNWSTENDLIYVITSGNNRLVVIDSKSMAPVYNVPLAGEPAEMNIVGDKIYISLPDLCRIDIFSKSDCAKEASLYFDHEVSSFCFDGDYIYYSEHDQFCNVFKKNLSTNELIQVGGYESFYFPKLYLNEKDRILYIGESGCTGSAIYYYDADTLVLKSVFEKNDYGIMNHTREIFHIGNEIFWGNYRLSDTNANELIGRYGTADYGSVVFASEELVSTYEGLFLTDTYECIINYYDANFRFEHILVSESSNIFFRQRSTDKNIIVGVNFELQ